MNELIAVPVESIKVMALAVARSGLFGIKTPEQAMALMLISQAEGRPPALAARDYDIIQGRPAKKAEAMLRDFLSAGGSVEWHSLTDELADATFSHPLGGKVRISWTMERAAAAGLGGKDMWKKYPRQMLRSRVVSEGVRTVYPAATSGMYVPEEAQDFEPRKAGKVYEAEIDAETGEVNPRIAELLDEIEMCQGLDEIDALAEKIKGEPEEVKSAVRDAYRAKRQGFRTDAIWASASSDG